MNKMIAQNNENSNTWSVLRIADTFGYSYQAQDSQFDNAAISEGWEVLFTGMLPEVATRYRDIYRTAGKPEATATPDLSDLLSYDFTEAIEDRDSSVAEEFDLVQILWQGRVIEGVITFFDDETVELDAFTEIPAAYFIEHATLIAKADADCGFITEYGKELERINKNWSVVYAVAAQTQTALEFGDVA